MAEFFDYSPHTGIRTDTSWNDETGEMTLHRYADVEPVIEYSKGLSKDADVSKRGIKESWWLYAKLPPIVILQLRAKGINVFDKNDEKRMFAELNTNFAYLKCTTGNHGGKTRVIA